MIGVVKYDAGNYTSVYNSLHRLNLPFQEVHTLNELGSISHLILPGVGHAAKAIASLKEQGFWDAIPGLTIPVLGICVGMQVLCEYNAEGDMPGLGIIKGDVVRFTQGKVPHMGWNRAISEKPEFKALETNYYFVHSFYHKVGPDTVMACDYHVKFSAVVKKNNFLASQFHPEKSGGAGEKFLLNWLENKL